MLFTCTYICGLELILSSMMVPRYFVLCFGGSLRILAVFGITGLSCGYIRGEATITSHLFWSRDGFIYATVDDTIRINILSIYFPAGQYFFDHADHNISIIDFLSIKSYIYCSSENKFYRHQNIHGL